jgi:hypothetical protein
VNLLLRFKSIWVYILLTALLVPPAGCGNKPAYLKEGKTAEVSERWKVQKIDPKLLSADEKSTLERLGTPDYIRFYRRLSQQREKVYAWVYADPVRLVTFIDGKKIDYVVLDEDLSSLNERQKDQLFWGGIITVSVVALGLLYYYFFAKD